MVVVSPNFSAPEAILYQSSSVKLFVNGQELGTGSLYITENNVVWGGGVSPSGAPLSTISVLYPTISMHALQRVPTGALMIIINYDLRLPELTPPEHGAGDADEDEDDEFDPDNQPITELKFLPQNDAVLVPLYDAMCQGQELNPDPADVDDDDHYMDGEEFAEGDDEEFEDAEESNMLPDEAAGRLRQMRLENGTEQEDSQEDAELSE